MLVSPISIIILREHGTSLVGQWLRLHTFQPKCPSTAGMDKRKCGPHTRWNITQP